MKTILVNFFTTNSILNETSNLWILVILKRNENSSIVIQRGNLFLLHLIPRLSAKYFYRFKIVIHCFDYSIFIFRNIFFSLRVV